MDDLIRLLEENARTPDEVLARHLGITPEEVRQKIRKLEEDRVILAHKSIVDDERAGREIVKAVIEVKLTPERGGGFNRIAERIARYPQVVSCYLMSGAYDVLVTIEGASLREVASFVSEKLSTLEGVRGTATHFLLKTYKEQGVMHLQDQDGERLKVTP